MDAKELITSPVKANERNLRKRQLSTTRKSTWRYHNCPCFFIICHFSKQLSTLKRSPIIKTKGMKEGKNGQKATRCVHERRDRLKKRGSEVRVRLVGWPGWQSIDGCRQDLHPCLFLFRRPLPTVLNPSPSFAQNLSAPTNRISSTNYPPSWEQEIEPSDN